MKVAVIMGSKSDWPVLEKTVAELKKFGVEVEARVMTQKSGAGCRFC